MNKPFSDFLDKLGELGVCSITLNKTKWDELYELVKKEYSFSNEDENSKWNVAMFSSYKSFHYKLLDDGKFFYDYKGRRINVRLKKDRKQKIENPSDYDLITQGD